MKQWLKRLSAVRILLFFLGSCLAVNALFATLLSNFHTGTLLTWLLALCFLLSGFFHRQISEKFPRSLRAALLILLCLPLLSGALLFAYGKQDTATYGEDALIVLGAGIRGEIPGKALTARLERAVEYHRKNPDALILVSGGQGPGEDITEALAMERYLLQAGIPAELIVKEENATSTGENFSFGKAILDKRLPKSYTVCILTTDYHVYRARYLSAVAGFDAVSSCCASTPLHSVIPSTLRECLAVFKAWIFKM